MQAVHHQTRSWTILSSPERDRKLVQLGLSKEILDRVRARTPRLRLLEAARVALTIDDEPNSDLVDYIAGYATRGGVYHHFVSLAELFASTGVSRERIRLPSISLLRGEIDLASIIPETLAGTPVHTDDLEDGKRFRAWQKVNGGTREVVLNRAVRQIPFLAGVVLYAGEGTKSLKSGRVEVANSNPGILRVHVNFLNELGFAKSLLRARVQIHALEEKEEGERLWMKELGLRQLQFTKPLLSPPGNLKARRTFTLQLSYANTMLLFLLRHWIQRVDQLVHEIDIA